MIETRVLTHALSNLLELLGVEQRSKLRVDVTTSTSTSTWRVRHSVVLRSVICVVTITTIVGVMATIAHLSLGHQCLHSFHVRHLEED